MKWSRKKTLNLFFLVFVLKALISTCYGMYELVFYFPGLCVVRFTATNMDFWCKEVLYLMFNWRVSTQPYNQVQVYTSEWKYGNKWVIFNRYFWNNLNLLCNIIIRICFRNLEHIEKTLLCKHQSMWNLCFFACIIKVDEVGTV